MTMQNPQARQFRQSPRPTHMWDPQRGVVPMDPNAPAKFVPPPPPEVVEAYMRGMARRQNVDTDMGQPGFPSRQANPIELAQLQSGGRSGGYGSIGLSYPPSPGSVPMPQMLGDMVGKSGMDNELRHFWPRPPEPLAPNTHTPENYGYRTQRY